jgi:hypothetical protein
MHERKKLQEGWWSFKADRVRIKKKEVLPFL